MYYIQYVTLLSKIVKHLVLIFITNQRNIITFSKISIPSKFKIKVFEFCFFFQSSRNSDKIIIFKNPITDDKSSHFLPQLTKKFKTSLGSKVISIKVLIEMEFKYFNLDKSSKSNKRFG